MGRLVHKNKRKWLAEQKHRHWEVGMWPCTDNESSLCNELIGATAEQVNESENQKNTGHFWR